MIMFSCSYKESYFGDKIVDLGVRIDTIACACTLNIC